MLGEREMKEKPFKYSFKLMLEEREKPFYFKIMLREAEE
jgi:hypothetical protein